MGDQNHRAALLFHLHHGLHQGGLAQIIQVGVRFIQHQQGWRAVERTGQTDALALAAREHAAGLADGGVIALGEMKNHVVHAAGLGGSNHTLGIDVAEAADVFGNGAVEEFDILGQIANGGAHLGLVPGEDVHAIQSHLAHLGRPHAHHGARQGGFAGGRRPDDADDLGRTHGEVHTLHYRCLGARRGDVNVFRCEHAARPWQAHAVFANGEGCQQFLQAVITGLGSGETLPGADQQFHWGERTTHQDGCRDHDAGADLVLHRQPCAQAERS